MSFLRIVPLLFLLPASLVLLVAVPASTQQIIIPRQPLQPPRQPPPPQPAPRQLIPAQPIPRQPAPTQPIPTQQNQPMLLPVAETKLLMEGLAQPNFQGLEQLLKDQPTSVQSWTFGRGQALLIAETANLMMLRPPRGTGRAIWLDHAVKLRESATQLAHACAEQDLSRSRSLLVGVANRCNACHSNFRVQVEIVPFAKR